MLGTLVIVTGVAALTLGFIYRLTKEPIEQARLEKQMKAIRSVTGNYRNNPVEESYEVFREKGKKFKHRKRHRERRHQEDKVETKRLDEIEMVLSFFPVELENGDQVTAINVYSDNGYSGRIELIVGITQNGSINNIEVISHKETPGLGSKIKDKEFIDQFIGKTAEDLDMRVKKDGGGVDGISGATISSRAFCEAVKQALEAYKDVKNEEGSDF